MHGITVHKILITQLQLFEFRAYWLVYVPPDLTPTRHAMYVLRNNEARSCNHYCSAEAISTTYSVCLFVALGIQQAKLMNHIVICGLSGSTIFFHIIS